VREPSDAEWRILASYIPAGGTVAGRGGGPVTYPRRDIVDAIRYLDHNSCEWRSLPVDFPPWPTVYYSFRTWNRDGTLTAPHNSLREQLRRAEGGHAEPSAPILGSQRQRRQHDLATLAVDLRTRWPCSSPRSEMLARRPRCPVQRQQPTSILRIKTAGRCWLTRVPARCWASARTAPRR
jgi:transposase